MFKENYVQRTEDCGSVPTAVANVATQVDFPPPNSYCVVTASCSYIHRHRRFQNPKWIRRVLCWARHHFRVVWPVAASMFLYPPPLLHRFGTEVQFEERPSPLHGLISCRRRQAEEPSFERFATRQSSPPIL